MDAEPVITAYDFVNFYPNMDIMEAAQDTYDAAMLTPLEYTNINYKEGVKYIASCLSEQEVLD